MVKKVLNRVRTGIGMLAIAVGLGSLASFGVDLGAFAIIGPIAGVGGLVLILSGMNKI